MSNNSSRDQSPPRQVPISHSEVKTIGDLKQVESFAEPSLITTERSFDIGHPGEKKQISSPFVQKVFCV